MFVKSALSKRVLSAILGVPLILLAVWYGGIYLLLLTALIMFLSLIEMSYLISGLGIKPQPLLAYIGGTVLLFAVYMYENAYSLSALTFIVLLYLILPLLYKEKVSVISLSVTFFTTLYIGLITYIFLIRNLSEGLVWLLFLLVCTWVNDTMAFFGGKKFGSVQLAPKLSPGKTREGAISGITGTLIAAYIFSLFHSSISYLAFLPLGLLIAVSGLVGDLVQSSMKREAGVKDAGKLIPGHGGVTDRFDSMLLSAPLVYYYVGLFIIR